MTEKAGGLHRGGKLARASVGDSRPPPEGHWLLRIDFKPPKGFRIGLVRFGNPPKVDLATRAGALVVGVGAALVIKSPAPGRPLLWSGNRPTPSDQA